MNLPKINYYKLLYVLLFVYLCWPSRFAMFYYENIPGDEIFDNLIKKTCKNVTGFTDKGIQCVSRWTIRWIHELTSFLLQDYTELLEENHFFYKKPFTTSDVINRAEIRIGGEYWPEECNPSFSTAVIVPYRDRAEQLKHFLSYLHNYLRKQNLHYKIFIVEQNDEKPFNRAKLFNIGAKVRSSWRWIAKCLLFHVF